MLLYFKVDFIINACPHNPFFLMEITGYETFYYRHNKAAGFILQQLILRDEMDGILKGDDCSQLGFPWVQCSRAHRSHSSKNI